MRVTNKLRAFKLFLRRSSIILLTVGMLVSSYGIYLQATPVDAANGYTDADCAPPNGTGAHLDAIVFAGSTKVGNIGSMLWVKNCSLNNNHLVNAILYKKVCETQTGRCDTIIETKNSDMVDLPPGGTYNFIASDFSITCGSAGTDIKVNGIPETAGTYYQSPSGPCTHTTPTTKPTTPPPTNSKIQIVGRVYEGTNFWQNTQNTCGSNYPASANLAVGGYPVNQCNPQPFFSSGAIDPLNKTVSVTGLPAGYTCTSWTHQLFNKSTNAIETVAVGSGCTMSGNFSALGSQYDGSHHVTFAIAKSPTPQPTVTAVPVTPTPSPTHAPSMIPSPTSKPTLTPTPSPTITPTVTNTPMPSPTITTTPTASPTASPLVNTQLKVCKYEDDNADGIHNNGENTLSWKFNYVVNGVRNSVSSSWWNVLNQGCAIVNVPSNAQISVSEEAKSGWRPTAVYADGARVDNGVIQDNFTYNYTASRDDVKVMWFLNTFTPNTAQPSITPSSTSSALPSSTASATPTSIPTSTPIPSSSSAPTATPTPSISASPTTSPNPNSTTQLKMCKYEDVNGDGIHNTGEGIKSWTFNYLYGGITHKVSSSWWNILTQGCAIVNVPINTQIAVSEQEAAGWTQTGIFADGAKIDGATHTYTSSVDAPKVVWFLNHQTPGSTPSSTPTPTPIVTASPTITASPTASPVVAAINTNYNITIEKRVDGTRVDGDKVGIQYRIKIKNNSDSNFNNFEIKDTLPPDFIYDQNTTEGDLRSNPDEQDVSANDNRRLVWKVGILEKGKELNFGYRTTGKREDKNYCNDARLEKEGSLIATSQACVRIDQPSTAVLGVSTDKSLPATGTVPIFAMGIVLISLAGVGWRLSKHIE